MKRETLLPLGWTAILVGYLSVWLPGPSAGLQFIGVEIGEWVKFLPEVQAGNVFPGRDAFYLPPITLALLMIIYSAKWPTKRWQTWAFRGLAILVSLLAFPSIDAIRREPSSEWALRLGLIALVALLSVAMIWLGQRFPRKWGMILVALVGLAIPSWAYLAVRPGVADLIQTPIGIGLGVWLNLLGHLLIGFTAISSRAVDSQ